MTTHELARRLLDGPDCMVTVRGYEGGVYEVMHVEEPHPLSLDVHSAEDWYFGPHEYGERDAPEVVMAVHIVGGRAQ